VNISKTGLLIEDIPAKVNEDAGLLIINMSTGKSTFNFQARPRWVSEQSHMKSMGMRISGSSTDWLNFAGEMDTGSRPSQQDARELHRI
jgi:hypothetical protein